MKNCSILPWIIWPLPRYYFAGGRVFAGGGLSIPNRKLSPVVLRFQITEILWFKGWSIFMAPGRLHSSTQVPQYQHSSGYSTIGGSFLTGFGIRTSERQISTHWLHPLQKVGSNSIARLGVGGLGSIYALSFIEFSFQELGDTDMITPQ